MAETHFEALERENERLKTRVYNLMLYLSWIEEMFPETYKSCENHFDGMPSCEDDVCIWDVKKDGEDWVI